MTVKPPPKAALVLGRLLTRRRLALVLFYGWAFTQTVPDAGSKTAVPKILQNDAPSCAAGAGKMAIPRSHLADSRSDQRPERAELASLYPIVRERLQLGGWPAPRDRNSAVNVTFCNGSSHSVHEIAFSIVRVSYRSSGRARFPLAPPQTYAGKWPMRPAR